ncbi:flippase-like domain-containing protein [Candidatus Saccharibacteria bacterium]|nr:flippase-like domain-containing protein [Candidatus Saccharibacteria bacterium]
MKATNKESTRALYSKKVKQAYLALTIVIILSLLIFWPQAQSFTQMLHTLRNVNDGVLLLSAVCTVLTYFASAYTIKKLALYKIRYSRTILIQSAGGFATKLVPAGLGGLALNTRYLIKNNHTVGEAASVAAINNIIGFLAHNILIVAALLSLNLSAGKLWNFSIPAIFWTVMCLVGAALLASLYFKIVRKKIRNLVKDLSSVLRIYNHDKVRLLSALLGALCVTVLYTLSLYLIARALDAPLSIQQTFFVFTIGIASAAVTPTPGGVGGAEAGITAALVSVGLVAPLALSVALAYRFITYWLPIIPGFLLFQYALRKSYI